MLVLHNLSITKKMSCCRGENPRSVYLGFELNISVLSIGCDSSFSVAIKATSRSQVTKFFDGGRNNSCDKSSPGYSAAHAWITVLIMEFLSPKDFMLRASA